MALINRDTLAGLLAKPAGGGAQVFLLFGERYLCRNAAEQLEQVLLAERGGAVHAIDGDREDLAATLAKLRSFSLLPGRQIYRVTDTRLFLSRQVAKNLWDKAVKAHGEGRTEAAGRNLRAFAQSGGLDPATAGREFAAITSGEWQQCFGFAHPGGDLGWTAPYLAEAAAIKSEGGAAADPADQLAQALAKGLPSANVLILLAEDVDKRKKLFKLLKEEQTVIDLSVEGGSGAKAQKEQKSVLQDLVRRTLAEQGKTMAPALVDLLFERVGFQPVAVVMELRKVMTYIGDRLQISREDLDLLVARSRQEALFELTGALALGDREQTLTIGDRLQENGIHPLAVVAALRNFFRGLLLCRCLQEQPDIGFTAAMPAAAFQQQCLPRLKERSQWKKELGGHPFALYMQFKTASGFSLARLSRCLRLLLQAELRLKGSAIAAPTVLQHLLISLLPPPAAKEERPPVAALQNHLRALK